ncbi:hypothetical protein [Xylophilus sp. GOD-11R]|uniref:hypothetical protein n=1 Tax=Xylophilus sp. GOD-11R TaxID=3089814 RepID=UPI00298C4C44|nr:hypothetical protein [Xylophilus sp. GOD-11R]WPB55168.1 hypothetical protein R9X41_13475 [Xylophilus sp. GOD-11R]
MTSTACWQTALVSHMTREARVKVGAEGSSIKSAIGLARLIFSGTRKSGKFTWPQTVMNLPALIDTASADRSIEIVSARLALVGVVDFRSPPAHPTGCRGRGRNGCVWEGYFSALAYWRDEALLRLGGIDPGGEVMAN